MFGGLIKGIENEGLNKSTAPPTLFLGVLSGGNLTALKELHNLLCVTENISNSRVLPLVNRISYSVGSLALNCFSSYSASLLISK